MFDRLDVWEAGDDKTFGSITGTWTGVVGAATMMQGTAVCRPAAWPGRICRDVRWCYQSALR